MNILDTLMLQRSNFMRLHGREPNLIVMNPQEVAELMQELERWELIQLVHPQGNNEVRGMRLIRSHEVSGIVMAFE